VTIDDDGADLVANALQEKFGGMVVEYVAIANVLGEDGDYRLAFDSAEDQRSHTTLGLLDWAAAIERHHALEAWVYEDEDG